MLSQTHTAKSINDITKNTTCNVAKNMV